jgi:two-component system chemotaxis response regulator CheB
MAVILTGMGNDGTVGLRLLKRAGCFSIAQDEATCVVYGMPRAAVEAGVVDVVLPLEAIASRITAVVRGSCT